MFKINKSISDQCFRSVRRLEEDRADQGDPFGDDRTEPRAGEEGRLLIEY